jgi:hypothetical protein
MLRPQGIDLAAAQCTGMRQRIGKATHRPHVRPNEVGCLSPCVDAHRTPLIRWEAETVENRGHVVGRSAFGRSPTGSSRTSSRAGIARGQQVTAAHEHLTGMVRRGVLLMLYSGQRGSDMVRLGPTMVDEGGFDLGHRGQQKTGVRPWCPILPELGTEMATWEKRPGPYVLTEQGKPFTRAYFAATFKKAVADIPALKDCTLHGLRATAVIRLKRAGLTEVVISDIVGMSIKMVSHYCRFENKRESGKAALVMLAEHAAKKNVSATRNLS